MRAERNPLVPRVSRRRRRLLEEEEGGRGGGGEEMMMRRRVFLSSSCSSSSCSFYGYEVTFRPNHVSIGLVCLSLVLTSTTFQKV